MDGNILFVIIFYVMGILLSFYFFSSSVRKKRMMEDVATSKTSGVFIGLVELKGTAESESPLTTKLSGIPAVWYSWLITEEWIRTEEVTKYDEKGRSYTVSESRSGSDMVASGGESACFYLKDEFGVIRIDPRGAKIEPIQVFNRSCGTSDPLYYGAGPKEAVSGSTGRRNFFEKAIPLHAVLYAMGRSRVRKDVAAAELAWDKDAPQYILSLRTEREMISRHRVWAKISAVVFILLIAFGGLCVPNYPFFSLIGGFGAAFILGVHWLWLVHRSLVELRNRVRQSWANVDVELRRRYDLIPRLATLVSALKRHDRELLECIARLRAQAALTGDPYALLKQSPVGGTVQGIIEKYPELKSSEVFMNLHRNLVETEQRIALARNYYNEMVTSANTRREMFPDRWIARLTRMEKFFCFTAAEFEVAPVDVNLVSLK